MTGRRPSESTFTVRGADVPTARDAGRARRS